MPNSVGQNGAQQGARLHQERLQSSSNFFEELSRTRFPIQFSNTRECNDAQRILQTLTNTAFVENKNHSMLTKNANQENQNQGFSIGNNLDSKPSIS